MSESASVEGLSAEVRVLQVAGSGDLPDGTICWSIQPVRPDCRHNECSDLLELGPLYGS
jgi:hypothetical protein